MARLDTKKLMRQCRKMAAEQAAQAVDAAKELDANMVIMTEVNDNLVTSVVDETPESFTVCVTMEETDPISEMNANVVDLIEYLADFLTTTREAKREYEVCVEEEIKPNAAIQDILHAAEFAPSQLAEADLLTALHSFRVLRRAAKRQLEVTDIFQQWCERNKKPLAELSEALGAMRKVANRQPHDFYRWKTDAVGTKDAPLIKDEN